jgi:hypothetical protein
VPTQIEKLQAYASHLLDDMILLREKYAMLDPMLFDSHVSETWGRGARARGFQSLQKALFLSCCQDLAKVVLDRDKRAPSLSNIVARLEEEELRMALRELFAVWRMDIVDDDPVVTEALKRMELKEEAERRKQFDAIYAKLTSNWTELREAPAMDSFKTIRNKVTAHTELRLHVDEYKRVSLGALGLKWGDLRDCVEQVQAMVEAVGLLVRNAGFAWNMLDEQLSSSASGFWDTVPRVEGSQREEGV